MTPRPNSKPNDALISIIYRPSGHRSIANTHPQRPSPPHRPVIITPPLTPSPSLVIQFPRLLIRRRNIHRRQQLPPLLQILRRRRQQRKHIALHSHKRLPLPHRLDLLRRPQRRPRVRNIMLPQRPIDRLHDLEELGLLAPEARQAHADAAVQRAEPHGVDVLAALGQDGVQVVHRLLGLDLDDDGGLLVQVLPERQLGLDGRVGDAREPAAGWGGAGAVDFLAEFGGRDDVFCVFDRLDLRDHDAGAGVEGVADVGVVVAADSGGR